MAEQTVGTARVDVVVNTDQFDAAIKSAKRSVSDMSQAAQDQYNKLSAAEKRRVDSLINQANKIGLTRDQQVAYNAALKTQGPILDEITRKLAKNATATNAVATGLGNSGKTAKELQFAMRGLPAQLTDIGVGLASGQRPMMVLLQQGGQLKDMFGGIGPAARALGGAIAAMINPITVAAAAVGALFFAWKQGSDEAVDFNKALILTGNYAGVTAKEAQRLAEQMDALAGVTQSKAAAALMQVANTGHFTGEAFTQVTEAALAMQVATGKAIEDTIAEFEKIRKDPVKALLELNSTYHFLTKAQLAHIAQLQDEGREAEAAAEATRIYSGVLQDRAQEINASLGVLQSQWRNLKSVATETWDALLAVGREDTIASRLAQAAVLASQKNFGGAYAHLSGAAREGSVDRMVEAAMRQNDQLLQGVDSEKAAKELEEQRKAREDATRTWLQLQQQNLDKKQKQLEEEKRITEAGKLLGKTEAQINEELAKSRARFAESNKAREKKAGTDPTEGILARIRQQIALNQQAAESEGKVTASQRLRIQVEEELARIGGKASSARRAEIEAGLKQVEASEAAAEKAKTEARAKEELIRLTNQLTAAENNRRAQNEFDLMSIGRGGDELMRMERRLDIERQYEDGLKQLRDKGVAEDSESYRQQEQALRESRDRMLADEADFFDKRAALMNDWKTGAIRAFEDYAARVANVSERSYDLITGIFETSENYLAELIHTGSFSLKSFLDDISGQISKFVASQIMRQFTDALRGAGGGSGGDTAFGANSYSSGSGGWFSSLIGALFGGGRAGGGDVQPGRVYEVGEMNRPEMLMQGGRQFLIPGNQGRVEPIRGGNTYNVTVPVYGRTTTDTRNQIANAVSREQRLASRLT